MPAKASIKESPSETSIEDRIRRRAFELYVQRGSESGSELDDWLQAPTPKILNDGATERGQRCPRSSLHKNHPVSGFIATVDCGKIGRS